MDERIKLGALRKRAAMYVRMSTDHQKYSTENQADAIRDYAQCYNMEIVQTYADQGKSGLSLEGRDALKQLIDDVQTGTAGFEVILVLDITRWGRFQDADESAYYEYICRRAGIAVQYVAEQFENDGSPVSTIVKGVKRAMAGEYSRELSAKVFAGQCRLIELGYRQGGPAGYGLRRMLVDEQGTEKGPLRRGEHKSLQTDRVILVPGPAEEVEVVQWIYRAFVDECLLESQIASSLNERGGVTDLGSPWSRGTIHEILTNPKYIGSNVFNRTSFKLKKRRVVNDEAMWVRADGVFEGIVDPSYYYSAQGMIRQRSRKFTNDEMLAKLRALQESKGWLSGLIINEADDMPSSAVYAHRFGSLVRAYELIGYTPDRDFRYIEINRHLRKLHAATISDTMDKIRALGGAVRTDPVSGLLVVNEELKVSVLIARCHQTAAGLYRWKVHFEASLRPDLLLVIRMDSFNQNALDYYVLSSLDVEEPNIRLTENNALALDAYRFDDLEPLHCLLERVAIPEAA